MPVSLDGLENAFRQLHQDCLKHARRREALLAQVCQLLARPAGLSLTPLRTLSLQVHEQEHYLQELRAAVLEERNAIGMHTYRPPA